MEEKSQEINNAVSDMKNYAQRFKRNSDLYKNQGQIKEEIQNLKIDQKNKDNSELMRKLDHILVLLDVDNSKDESR